MAVATETQVADLVIGGRKLKPSEYIAKVEGTLVANVKNAMEKLGINLVDNLAKYSPADQGKLASSFSVIGVSETRTGYRLEIKVGVDYADYIDKGVRGIQNKRKTYKNEEGRYYQFKTYGMPLEALKQLEGWMQRKNIEIDASNLRIKSGDESMEGRQVLPQISNSAKRLAYYIKKYGIEGRQFIKKSIDEATPEFNVDIQTIGSDSLILRINK
jgi:hypothetical protein